jgi:hypothetical protein
VGAGVALLLGGAFSGPSLPLIIIGVALIGFGLIPRFARR